jgi:hypothetical protein
MPNTWVVEMYQLMEGRGSSKDSADLRTRHDYREGIVFRYQLMIGRVTGQFHSEESAAQLIC